MSEENLGLGDAAPMTRELEGRDRASLPPSTRWIHPAGLDMTINSTSAILKPMDESITVVRQNPTSLAPLGCSEGRDPSIW